MKRLADLTRDLMRDLRLAVRRLARNPAHTALAMVVLALRRLNTGICGSSSATAWRTGPAMALEGQRGAQQDGHDAAPGGLGQRAVLDPRGHCLAEAARVADVRDHPDDRPPPLFALARNGRPQTFPERVLPGEKLWRWPRRGRAPAPGRLATGVSSGADEGDEQGVVTSVRGAQGRKVAVARCRPGAG
jgi:hypothetical protein